jgi:hypothetical protein
MKVCLRSCQRYFSPVCLSALYQADLHSRSGFRKSTRVDERAAIISRKADLMAGKDKCL